MPDSPSAAERLGRRLARAVWPRAVISAEKQRQASDAVDFAVAWLRDYAESAGPDSMNARQAVRAAAQAMEGCTMNSQAEIILPPPSPDQEAYHEAIRRSRVLPGDPVLATVVRGLRRGRANASACSRTRHLLASRAILDTAAEQVRKARCLGVHAAALGMSCTDNPFVRAIGHEALAAAWVHGLRDATPGARN
jgi:hypothetical protein